MKKITEINTERAKRNPKLVQSKNERKEALREPMVLETVFTELFIEPLSSPRKFRPLAFVGAALGLVALGFTFLLARGK